MAAGLVSVQQLIRKAVSAGLGLFTGSRHKETLANVTHKYVLNVWQSVEIVTVSHEYQTSKRLRLRHCFALLIATSCFDTQTLTLKSSPVSCRIL